MDEDLQPIRQAAKIAGVSRTSVGEWVKRGLLKAKRGKVRHMETKLVSVAKVKELAKERRPGRPRKDH